MLFRNTITASKNANCTADGDKYYFAIFSFDNITQDKEKNEEIREVNFPEIQYLSGLDDSSQIIFHCGKSCKKISRKISI